MAIIKLTKKKLTTDLSPNTAKLVSLVEHAIAENPFHLDGRMWAARSQPEWAGMLGISLATLGRIISKPPFVRERTHNALGHQLTLLRVGNPDPKTPRHLANIMAKIFREKTGRYPTKHQYGCLYGCAEVWPDGQQVEIFKAAMNNWKTFMVGFRLALDTGQIQTSNPKEYAKSVPYLRLNYPHLPTLRLGVSVAFELYQMLQQEKCAWLSECLSVPY